MSRAEREASFLTIEVGRLPYSYTGFWRELDRACEVCGIGHIGTHTFRHSYRMWIDAIGTPIGVQQELMRHTDIRTTMTIYGETRNVECGLSPSLSPRHFKLRARENIRINERSSFYMCKR
jgi:integrase